MLANVSFVQAMCWITASLADALQFAHERGIVHLDLKPSNVLLATDGQPMLLDFHLAREPIRPNGPLPDNFGGTLPYMPDEQRAAMQSLQNGKPVNVTVDGRADIYALGAMLYESLGGKLPISADSPPLARLNPQVTTGLSDVIARSLASAPEDRYGTAGELAEDLRRHLTDQALIGVPNRDFAERWRKWRRRSPNRLRAVAMVVLILGAAGILAAGKLAHWREERQQAELALRDGQRQLQNGQNVPEAAQSFERGLALAKKLPFQGSLERELREQLRTAKRLQLTQQLHHLADEIRVLYGADFIPPAHLRSFASQSEAFWQKRDVVFNVLGAARNPELTADLMDMAIFAADLRVRLSGNPSSAEGHQQALKLLDEAETLFGPNPVLEHQRRITRLDAALTNGSAPPIPAHTAWEHYALGRAFLGSNDLPRAAQELAAALELEPAGRWPNFYYGLCACRMGRYEESIAAFSVCIGTAPNVAGYFYNRALSHAALGHSEQALHDYDRALQIDPTHAASALNRGVLHFQQSHYDRAIADLGLALQNGANPATVHYDLALVQRAAGNPSGALQQVRQALEHDPAHEPARNLLDTLESNTSKSDTGTVR
jgi:tetratricopeptide (TPR) repeat protein